MVLVLNMLNINIKRYHKLFWLFMFATVKFSCFSNFEPVISEIISNPNPVKKGGFVTLQCIAKDEDESSIRAKDFITYSWSSSAGFFLVPDSTKDTLYGVSDLFIVPDSIDSIFNGSLIYWLAVDSSGSETDTGFQSITCQVGDENNAIDILSILVKVQ